MDDLEDPVPIGGQELEGQGDAARNQEAEEDGAVEAPQTGDEEEDEGP